MCVHNNNNHDDIDDVAAAVYRGGLGLGGCSDKSTRLQFLDPLTHMDSFIPFRI